MAKKKAEVKTKTFVGVAEAEKFQKSKAFVDEGWVLVSVSKNKDGLKEFVYKKGE